jgi:hypothetical protein
LRIYLVGKGVAALNKVILQEKFALIDDHWHQRLVAEVNDSYVKLSKLKGEFVWHQHESEDELFR